MPSITPVMESSRVLQSVTITPSVTPAASEVPTTAAIRGLSVPAISGGISGLLIPVLFVIIIIVFVKGRKRYKIHTLTADNGSKTADNGSGTVVSVRNDTATIIDNECMSVSNYDQILPSQHTDMQCFKLRSVCININSYCSAISCGHSRNESEPLVHNPDIHCSNNVNIIIVHGHEMTDDSDSIHDQPLHHTAGDMQCSKQPNSRSVSGNTNEDCTGSPTVHITNESEPSASESVNHITTLSNLTSKGRRYMYVNKANDFSLEIPEGAIPERESITVDIGVALYGPYQYPEGLRPVSPVFWVCVRDKTNFQFLKPVTVSIPHFLDLESEDDIKSLGMTFLKADHEMNSQNMYEFQPTDGDMLFEPLKTYGVIQTMHFCYLCIASKVSRKQIRKAKYCLYVAIPRTMARCEPTYVYFFVTYLLSTCLETVKKQIMKIPELHDCISRSHEFQFSKDSDDPSIEIILPESWPPGWTVGLQFNTQVYTYMLET